MGRWFFPLASLLFLIGTCFPCGAASAETHDGIIILSVLLDGKPSAELQSLLTEHLKLDGQPMLESSLSSDEKICRQADCMSLIIQRRPGVGRLLRADIETLPAPSDGQIILPTYKVSVSEFVQASRKSWSKSAFCTSCASQKALSTILNNVAIQALSGPSPPAGTQQASPAGTVAPLPVPWTRARIATVATLGSASGVALIVGGVLISLNGQATSAYQCTPSRATPLPADPSACLFTTLPIGASLVGVGAALGVTAITLAFSWPGPGKKQRKLLSEETPYSITPSEIPPATP